MKYHYWKLFLDFLSSVSWPILIMLIIIFFEEQIRYLIKNVKKVNAGGGSIEINNLQQKQDEGSSLDTETLAVPINNPLVDYLNMYTESSRDIVKSSIEREASITLEPSLENFEGLSTYTILLYIEKHFQNLYRLIYGSQIEILYKLETNNNETKDSIKYIYDNAVAKLPDFYKDYSYGQYLQFMEKYAVIYIAENNNIVITDQGLDFLTFIERCNLSRTPGIY